VAGQVIMYADTITAAIRTCLDETGRRRILQAGFNEEHGITPQSIKTEIRQILGSVYEADYVTVPVAVSEEAAAYASEKELPVVIRGLKEEMKQAAKALEFEKAALLRDRVRDLTKLMIEMGGEG
jgi:excinuclease ABC subunit B